MKWVIGDLKMNFVISISRNATNIPFPQKKKFSEHPKKKKLQTPPTKEEKYLAIIKTHLLINAT